MAIYSLTLVIPGRTSFIFSSSRNNATMSCVVVLDFHNFFKGLDTSPIRIGKVSTSISIGYGYVKQIEVSVLHSLNGRS